MRGSDGRWRGAHGVLACVALVYGITSGCGVGDNDGSGPSATTATSTPGPVSAPMPAGLTAYVDQSRLGRQRGEVFVRLVNEPPGDVEREVEVLRAEVSSDRYDTTVWTGDKTFVNEADLDLALPPGRCGTGADASVELTYRIDDGPVTVSTTRAADRYGQVLLQLDRDCAAATLAEAAELTTGTPRVVGEGLDSVFEMPVILTPTGKRDDVAFAGFEDTVLFHQVAPSPSVDAGTRIPLTAGTARVVLRLVPTRCDPHALAEDKVGTLVGVRVTAPGLSPVASSYLPLTDDARRQLRGFFSSHCGF